MFRVEPIIAWLTGLLVFLVAALFCSEIWFKDDTQFFQVVSSMATGVLGALLGLITGKKMSQDTQTVNITGSRANTQVEAPATPPAETQRGGFGSTPEEKKNE